VAVLDYSTLVKGTPYVWKNTGGDKTLNLKNLGAASRQGDKSASLIDGTKGLPEILEFTLEAKFQVAPSAGLELQLYVGFSSSATAGTDNPAGLGGADAAGPNSDVFPQLAFVGSLVTSNNLGTATQRVAGMVVPPAKEYVTPVVSNGTGQTTTNADGETVLTMTPWYRARQG
jgi:hypothetical protein